MFKFCIHWVIFNFFKKIIVRTNFEGMFIAIFVLYPITFFVFWTVSLCFIEIRDFLVSVFAAESNYFFKFDYGIWIGIWSFWKFGNWYFKQNTVTLISRYLYLCRYWLTCLFYRCHHTSWSTLCQWVLDKICIQAIWHYCHKEQYL